MFSGEEGFGQFLDLTTQHEDYLNLPGAKRLPYTQYLEVFDSFVPPHLLIKRPNKISDRYFNYVGELATYLENFIKKVRPLQGLDTLFASLDEEFERQWTANEVPGWAEEKAEDDMQGPKTEGSGEGIWCPDCEKEFKNENVYKNHLTGKKHIRAAEARKAAGGGDESSAPTNTGASSAVHRLKERAVAEREHRVRSLAKVLEKERQATRINVERKQGMTERERQMELDAIYAESEVPGEGREEEESDNEGDDRIYNPLKLPLAWDGKPIPYWLYKLHGLGVEYTCEICGNFVYMGRRAFDKHFSEALHIFGLKCLGITSNTNLFREITRIEDAVKLWEKLEQEKKKDRDSRDNVVQMEDAEGNVMPERVYLEYVPPFFVWLNRYADYAQVFKNRVFSSSPFPSVSFISSIYWVIVLKARSLADVGFPFPRCLGRVNRLLSSAYAFLKSSCILLETTSTEILYHFTCFHPSCFTPWSLGSPAWSQCNVALHGNMNGQFERASDHD